jgi:hypothetical protein
MRRRLASEGQAIGKLRAAGVIHIAFRDQPLGQGKRLLSHKRIIQQVERLRSNCRRIAAAGDEPLLGEIEHGQ